MSIKYTGKIAIIGGGNLGISIAEGLLKSNYCPPGNITVTRRNSGPLQELNKKGIHTSTDNNLAVKAADVVIVAVKPFQVKEVVSAFQQSLRKGQI